MDGDTSSKFVASLVKSIQALCNGYIDFSSSIEVIGHIHLRIDQNQKFNYILSEEVSKSKSEAATVFQSHSYHSQPPPSATPSSTKSASSSDSPGRSRRKSHQVPRIDESDPLVVSAHPPDLPSGSGDSGSSRLKGSQQLSEGGDSPHSSSFSDTDKKHDSQKQRNGSSSGRQVTKKQDSLDRRRKAQAESRSHDSGPKKSRTSGSPAAKSGFDVIEIKEEPDDSSSYFGDGNAAGQGMIPPDFSNLVADSLDRVSQLEGASLLAGGMTHPTPQDQPFPVMLHANSSSATSSSVDLPGPSDPSALASSSGETLTFGEGAQILPSHDDEFIEDSEDQEFEIECNEDDDEPEGPIEVDVSSLLPHAFRNRGRPRKYPPVPSQEIVHVSLPSRPRGRPPKGSAVAVDMPSGGTIHKSSRIPSKRGPYKMYSSKDLREAVKMVEEGQCTFKSAAAKYNIPLSTLVQRYAYLSVESDKKRGQPGCEETSTESGRGEQSGKMRVVYGYI